MDRAKTIKTLSGNFSSSYIAALELNMAEIRKMIGFGTNTPYHQISNFQFQIIKSTILFNGGIEIIDQGAFLSAQAASFADINGLTYKVTSADGSLIEAD